MGIMGLLNMGTKIAGSIFGGLKASRAINNALEENTKSINQELKDNEDWYYRRYNEDATQRADAQRMLAMTNELLKQRNMDAKGTQAVMGGTEESLAATKAANTNALADTAAQIAVAGAQRKDNVENQFLNTKSSLNKEMRDSNMTAAQTKANNIIKAVGGLNEATSDIKNLG